MPFWQASTTLSATFDRCVNGNCASDPIRSLAHARRGLGAHPLLPAICLGPRALAVPKTARSNSRLVLILGQALIDNRIERLDQIEILCRGHDSHRAIHPEFADGPVKDRQIEFPI